MSKKFKVKSVTINQLSEREYDFTVPKAGIDAHCRLEPVTGWVLDVFKGQEHVLTESVADSFASQPDFTHIVTTLLNWNEHEQHQPK